MTSRRTTLLRKGLLIILLPVVSQIALFLFLLSQQRSHDRMQESVVHTKEVIQQVDGLLEALLLRRLELRGRLLGMPAEREITSGEVDADIAQRVAALTALTADNPLQQQRLAQLKGAIAARREWADRVRQLIDIGQQQEALAQFQSGRGAELIEAVRTQMEDIRAEENRLDRERIAALRQATRFQNVIVLGGVVIAIVVAALTMWLFGRGIARRVRAVTDDVGRLRTGETLSTPIAGGDELGDLHQSFHLMASALNDARLRDLQSQALIGRRNDELLRANHELEQKNSENEMFVYSVSHDLRSPLVNLQGFSRELGLVRDDLRTIFDGELTDAERARGRQMIDRDITESIRFIQTAVMRLSTIIDALLRLSRAGRVEYQPLSVPLAPIIARILDAMRDSIVQRKATVNVGPLPTVWGDPTALEQIFANLIGNAVNYLDPARPGVIEVGLQVSESDDAEDLRFFVRDNGLGIPTAYLPKVFAVFQRLHAKMAPGEGIGLALVRRTVERHGGRIWVESTEGVGSTFFVSLPRIENSPLKLVPKKESLSLRSSLSTKPALPIPHVH